MLRRNLERFYYLSLLISLHSAYFIIQTLSFFSFWFSKTKKGDVIFFPHEQAGSDGYIKRVEQYLPYFSADNISYYVAELFPDAYIKKCLNGTKSEQFYLYHQIIWKRIGQVLKARHYKAAFIQRRLFASYPDSRKAHLERLLRKLNNNITVDYWDSVWLNSPILYKDIVLHVDKISVVNQYVFDYFKKASAAKHIFPIAVDLTQFEKKIDYEIHNEIKLFWTGLPGNLIHIKSLSSVLQKLAKQYNITLLLVCAETIHIEGVKVSQHKWQKENFFQLLRSSDIGLYPCEDNEEGRGKMAMKVVEYMACALPCVGNDVGLTPYAKHNENILIASNEQEWYDCLNSLIQKKELRMKLGINGRKTIEEFHTLEKSFQTYKNIIFS